MSQAINAFNAALAVSCLALSACGGDSSGESAASANSDNMKAAATVAQATASISGTRIPTAKQIVDSSGNVWTVASGVIYENGKLAGYSNAVTLLVYDNKTIYQENTAGGWWSWSGGTWVGSSDPLTVTTSGGGSGTTTTTGTASVSWDAPTQDTNGEALTDLAGYTIYYGTSASALTKTIQVANPGATNYVVSNLSAGTYYFAVAAYTTTGTVSAQSAVHSKTIP